MKSPRPSSRSPRQPAPRSYARFLSLESLETRILMSANVGYTQPLARLPNEATTPPSLTTPVFSNEWYFDNYGQTITTAVAGPSIGKPGADISATDAWDLTTGSNTVVIAVLDTGVDLTNPDLAANIWTNPGNIPGDTFVNDIHGWNFVDGNNNVQDTIGHGTTTNGVIGAVGNNGVGVTGVAWNVKLLDVKVGDASGVSDANLIAGINYINMLKKGGVNIVAINASYFGVGGMSPADLAAIKSAGDNGMLYIAAAGNIGLNLDIIPSGFLPSNMILVAATDAQDNLASFSDYGPNTVALGAPGVDITTTVFDGLDLPLSGTSYAAPMVSGTIALMKSLVPGATMSQIESALLSSTDADPALVGKTTYGRLDTYKALETLLGPHAPVGAVDSMTTTNVTGWAFDPNAGAKPVTVELVIDGVIRATSSANLARTDLTGILGSTDHGYSFTLPALTGTHTIQIIALDFDPFRTALAPTVIKTQVVSSPTPPVGTVDSATRTTVTGWTIDPNTPSTPVTIRVDVDGTTVGTYTANLPRAGLQAIYGSVNHGFSITLPTLSATYHRIDVYAYDTDTNLPTLIASRTVNGNAPPVGTIDAFNGSTFSGWAVDPDSPATSIQISYSIDGNAPTIANTSIARPGLMALYGSVNHGYSITLPQLIPGSHSLTVYAIDPDDNALVSLGTKTAVVANPAGRSLPIGTIDLATTGNVYGWALDPTAGAAPINIRVDIDGVPGTPTPANINRPGLTALFGSANHGFSQNLSLSPGEHTIAVYAIGSPSDEIVLLGTRVVGVTPSVGSFDAITGSTITGWAFNPTLAANPATVRLDIDGTAGPITLANLSRPELTATFGSSLHGFSFTLPTLSPGTHTLTLQVLDATTLQTTSVATTTLTV